MYGQTWRIAAPVVAVLIAGGAASMPLQSPTRDGEAGAEARTSRAYSLPDDGAAGGRGGGPSTVPDWVREQEVYQKRTGGTVFTVRIENISPDDAMRFSDGTTMPAGMSHGVYAVWREFNPIIRPDDFLDFSSGLEQLAEDGNVRPMQAFLRSNPAALETGIVYEPLGASGDEELWPGKVYEVTFTADPGDKLSFVTMLMQSNDLVYAPEGGHLELFDEAGRPVTGDVTGHFVLYDVGTEVNQDPKIGPDTGTNQESLNQGEDEDELIRPVDDGFPYPPVESVLRVTLRTG